MKHSAFCSSGKIELKNKQRSVSISQIKGADIHKLIANEISYKGSQLIKYNESTPKTSRRLSKDMLSPGYRKKVKTIIHKSSPMNFDLNIGGQVKIEQHEKKCFGLTRGFNVTVRRNFLNSEKSVENMKETASRSHFTEKINARPPELYDLNVLEKVKQKFQSFKNNHYTILNEFKV
jgi:hypothetical protein